MMDGPLPPNKIDDSFDGPFQTGREGISVDYMNEINIIRRRSKSLLKVPGFEASQSEEELRTRILDKMKRFRSYTEYMDDLRKNRKIELAPFLTPKGREIVVRLDQIAEEIKSLIVEDPQAINVAHLAELLEEIRKLVKSQ